MENVRKKDRINRLPDSVLVSIVSLLPGTDAVRTCVLSRRWEKLWTFTTGTLSFHEPSKWAFKMYKSTMIKQRDLIDRYKARFISWVNRALQSHQALTIQEFSIKSVLDSSSASDIDTWLRFAIEKSVQRLHLNFNPRVCVATNSEKFYHFPLASLLRDSPATESFSCFNSLTELSLLYIIVDDQQLNHFISSCPFLTKLVVVASPSLVNLRVAGPPSLKLNYLNITSCFKLKSIEISAPNLVFFKYYGYRISISLTKSPKLVEVQFGGGCAIALNNYTPGELSYLSQLKSLTLMYSFLQYLRIREIPELLNLKQLVLINVYANVKQSLRPFTRLLKAAPFLHKFVLELSTSRNKQRKRKVSKVTKFSHQCLKVVELIGFGGFPVDVELAMHLLETAISLEEIIIIPRCGGDLRETKKCAKQLKRKLPAGARLRVLEPNPDLELELFSSGSS